MQRLKAEISASESVPYCNQVKVRNIILFVFICFFILVKNIAYALPPNEPPVASDVVANTLTVTATRQAIHALLAYDAGGPVSVFTLVTVPTFGSLHIGSTGGNALTAGTTLTATQAANLYYTPPVALLLFPTAGMYTFTYTATDSEGVVSNTADYFIPVGDSNTPNTPTPATIISTYMPNTNDQTRIPGLKATGGTIEGYRITSLPKASEGVLYMSSTETGDRIAITELTDGYYQLTTAQADNLWFDPAPTFEGKATFTFAASNQKSPDYSEAATYTIPVYNQNSLPVELMSFRGAVSKGNLTCLLYWETATEQNSDYFSIERRTTSEEFESIGTVRATGNSSSFLQYSFTDLKPAAGTNYYRLRMVDIDGTEELSKVIALKLSAVRTKDTGLATVYPSLASTQVIISLNAPDQNTTVTVLDATGKQVAAFKRIRENMLTLPVSDLKNGLYFVKVTTGVNQETIRFMKQ